MAAERDDGLARLLEDWFFALESGAAPTPAEHCAARPDLLPEFERLLGRSAEVDRLFRAPTGPSTAATRAPELLGEFEVLEPIGSGGVGEVWLARQTSLQRLVALKVVRRRGDARTRARLRREAEVAASLEHPGIVPIYGVGDDDERAWIAMKWLTGPALDGLELPLEPLRAARIAAAAARALHAAHLAGAQLADQRVLGVVGVLVLVDHQVAEAVLVAGADHVVLAQQLHRADDQVAEVDAVLLAELFLVAGVDLARDVVVHVRALHHVARGEQVALVAPDRAPDRAG